MIDNGMCLYKYGSKLRNKLDLIQLKQEFSELDPRHFGVIPFIQAKEILQKRFFIKEKYS